MDDSNSDTTARIIQTCTCLLCGDTSTYVLTPEGNRIFIKEEEGSQNSGDEERGPNYSWEIELFKFFVSYTKILYKGQNEWKSYWNLETEPVPLCGVCKDEIRKLKDSYEEIQRLEKLLNGRMKTFKEKILENESRFDDDLYRTDERYFWSRAKLLGESVIRKAHPKPKLPGDKTVGRPLAKKRKSRGSERSLKKTIKVETPKESAINDTDITEDADITFTPPDPLDIIEPEPPDEAGSVFMSADADNVAETTDEATKLVESSETSLSSPTFKKPTGGRNPGSRFRLQTRRLIAESENVFGSVPSEGRPRRAAAAKARLKDDLDPETLNLSDFEDEEMPARKKGRVDRDEWERMDEDERKDCVIRKKKGREAYYKHDLNFDEDTGKYHYLNTYFDKVDEKIFKCTECNEVFTEVRINYAEGKVKLKRHAVRVHLSFKCPWPYCNYVGKTKGKTEIHFLNYHDKIKSKKLECEICGMPGARTTLHGYKIHRSTHYNKEEKEEAMRRGEVPKPRPKTKCPKCGIDIKSGYLKKHLNICGSEETDSSKESHLCPQCGKSFPSADYLRLHTKRVHPNPNDLRFACVYCDRRFVRHKELQIHKVIHTGEYPYPCPLCDKMFAAKYNFDLHMKLHKNERPYQCEYCPTAFNRSEPLTRHINLYHSEGGKPKRASFIKDPNRGRFGGRWLTKKTGDAHLRKKQDTSTDAESQPQQSHSSSAASTSMSMSYINLNASDNSIA